jgi:hypothetical protein
MNTCLASKGFLASLIPLDRASTQQEKNLPFSLDR